jgi:hypothetical protein
MPIYASLPDLNDMLTTRSKSRKFLEAAGVPLCPAVISLASDVTGLLAHLAKAMQMEPLANHWIFTPSTKQNQDYPFGQVPTAYISKFLKLLLYQRNEF